MNVQTPPVAVLGAFELAGASVRHVPGGLINQTHIVERGDERLVLQRVHAVFGPDVHEDIEAVTAHLAGKGIETPRLRRTTDGALWTKSSGAIWRMLTYLEGSTVHRCTDPRQAEVGFALIARFHHAVADFEYEFQFVRAGVHDTAAHLQRLRDVCTDDLSGEILDAADALPDLGELPRRVTHGDLKISNVLFADESPPRARCLIDLDTLGRQTMAYELGDALRSWCNPSGEDVDRADIDRDVFEAAMRGYASAHTELLTAAEVDALVPGLETVCVELAARFCVDAAEDTYFGWDAARFESRTAHNLVRARGQLALARAVRSARAELDEKVSRYLR